MMWIRQGLIAMLALSVVLHINEMGKHIREWHVWRYQFENIKIERRIRQKFLRHTKCRIVLHFIGIVLEILIIIALMLPWVIS